MPRLTSQAIINFCSINDFQNTTQWTIRASDPNTLYFQLFDLDNQNTVPYSAPWNGGFFGINQTNPQRYMAGVGASNQPFSLTVTFPSLDPQQTFTFNAVVDPNDSSVWHIDIPGYASTAVSPSSGNVIFSLTQGAKIWTWTSINLLAVEMTNQGCC